MGQALTVLGNPLMAAAILYLANQKAVMGSYRNRIFSNVVGGLGFVVVLFLAVRVLLSVITKLT
jgi:Mn2+/Fe2+ NRAMP family transporter